MLYKVVRCALLFITISNEEFGIAIAGTQQHGFKIRLVYKVIMNESFKLIAGKEGVNVVLASTTATNIIYLKDLHFFLR